MAGQAALRVLGGRTAKLISDGKITKATQVSTELRELYVPDSQFQTDFQTKIEREGKKAALLLKGLEHQYLLKHQDVHAKELVPSGSITVEHILPKSPGDNWKQELKADKELQNDCLHRLGNLCLLADVNRSLGNKSFADKKKVFVTSEIQITKTVASFPNWGRAEIDKRQKDLAAGCR